MKRFENKIMLVTGATSGIGKAVALRAAGEGALSLIHIQMCIRDRDEDVLKRIQEALRQEGILYDKDN